MTLTLLAAIVISAVYGASAAGLYLAWPRRLTAEEWLLHRRAMSTPSPQPVSARAQPGINVQSLVHQLERVERLAAIARTDLALLKLAGEPASASEQEFLRRLALQTLGGGAGGLLLLGLLILGSGGLKVAPMVILLPVAFALLVPAWSWLTLRRRAGRLRSGIEHRLPRLLVAARVLLESGAATPEGALTQAVTIYEEPAADIVREALRLHEVRSLSLEAALDDGAQRYQVTALEQLANSFRVGSRYGTRMAQLLSDQSIQLRQAWFAAYRERITRAPVVMTIPAMLFFVAPFLTLIMFLVFTPLVRALGQL